MRPLSLKGHERALTRIRLNHDGDILFSSSKDKFICIWYVDNGERIGTYDGHSGAVWDVDVSWDTRTLVSASGDGYVKIWDVEQGTCITDIKTTVGRSISTSYSGRLVAFTANKMTNVPASFSVIDLREPNADGNPSFVLNTTLSSQSDCCTFSHLDDSVIIGCQDGSLHLYDLRNSKDAVNFSQPHGHKISDLQISNDQGLLISASSDKTAQLHNARTLEPLKKYKSGRNVNSAAISPARDHIVLGGGEEATVVTQTAAASGQFEAKLYHMVYEEEFARFKGHFGPINSIAFNPTGNIVVSGSEDGYIRIQELDQEYLDFEFDY